MRKSAHTICSRLSVGSSASTGTSVGLKVSGRLYYEDEGSILTLVLSPHHMLGFFPQLQAVVKDYESFQRIRVARAHSSMTVSARSTSETLMTNGLFVWCGKDSNFSTASSKRL
jgi:hypothetical protein